jgi:hypothetical protein
MGWLGRGPNVMELGNVSKLVGVYYTVPPAELRAARKAWAKAWKATKVSAGDFIVDRYGLQVDDGTVVPTRGAALYAPLHWEPHDGFGPVAACRFVLDARAGKFHS